MTTKKIAILVARHDFTVRDITTATNGCVEVLNLDTNTMLFSQCIRKSAKSHPPKLIIATDLTEIVMTIVCSSFNETFKLTKL